MFSSIEATLMEHVHTMSLEAFVFFASIVEEIIAPIPSPTVMVLSGSFAQVQGMPLEGLLVLAVIGAFGKVIGALVVYFIAKEARDFVLNTCGKYFKVTQRDVDALGARLGRGARDYAVLTFLRALPIMPSVVLSVGSGLLHIPLRLYIISTFVGTIVRDGFYLYAGYVGTDVFRNIIPFFDHVEDGVLIGSALLFSAGAFYWYTQRKPATPSDTPQA